MLTKSKIVSFLSLALAIILIVLAFSLTLIAIFFPEVLDGGGFDWSGYDSNLDATGQLPSLDGALDLNGNLLGDGLGGLGGNGGGSGDGGGEIDLSRVVFRVFATEDNDAVYFRQGSYAMCQGNEWFEAQPFKSKTYSYINTTYFTGQHILQSGYGYEKNMSIETLDGTLVTPYYPTFSIELPETVYPDEKENFQYIVSYVDYNEIILPSYEMQEFVMEYEEYARSVYLELTPETQEYMDRIIKEQRFRKNSKNIVSEVAEYIKNAKTYDMDFDPALEEEENIPVAFLEEYESGVCRHFAASATMLYRALGIPARYTVGFLGSTVAEEWVDVTAGRAHAWVEIFVSGFGWQPVDVTPPIQNDNPPSELIPIEIKPADIEMLGDANTILSCDRIEGFEEYEAKGYSYDVEFSGEQVGLGKSRISIENIIIYNEKNEDVTDQFDIKSKEGILHVYYSELTLRSSDHTVVYTGDSFMGSTIEEANNSYYGEHSIKPIFMTSARNVGTVSNVFIANIVNEQGNDITDHYKINYEYGDIEVTHAYIELRAADAEKLYDGKPLECNSYEFIVNNLAPWHCIDESMIRYIGSQTERGRSECIIDITSIVIRDGAGRDVTSNYKIKTYVGHLRVR